MSGDVPEGWRHAKLGEVAALSGGTTPSKTNDTYWADGTVLWATPSDITSLPLGRSRIAVTEAHIAEIALKECSLKLNPPGTVLMTSRATIGYAAINDVPMATNQGFLNFTCSHDCDPEFLCHWLNSNRGLLTAAAGGSTFKELSRGTAKLLPILLPSLDEQRRIADVLRSVDEALATYDDVAKTVANVVQRLSSHYFIDPAIYDGPHPLGSFGDLFDIKGGSQPPKATFVYEPKPGFVRLLQIRDFERDDKAAYISEGSSSVRCREDDILIARYGASVGRILTGKAGAYNVALTKVVLRGDRINRRYAYHWLKSDYFQNRIAAVSGRSAQAGFNKEDLFPTKVVLPQYEEQAIVADTLDDLEKQAVLVENTREAALALKSSLLSDLLTGRVRVPE